MGNYQHHVVLEVHLQSRCIVVGPQVATSGRVGTGMEKCEVQNVIALRLLFSVYLTHDLCLWRFACVLKSLCDSDP